MRIDSLKISNSPPVVLFEAVGLTDVVVLAGPNGVGKTRLIQSIINFLRSGATGSGVSATVSATSADENGQWGKASLNLDDPADLQLLRQTFQKSKLRKNWSSSLVNFESDRSIRNLQPLAYSWDVVDPYDDEVGWESTFGFMRDRFQDTVHSMFRIIEAQKQSIANRALQLKKEGKDQMNLGFSDPMEPFKDVFAKLLGTKELIDPSPRTNRLQYTVDGELYDFDSLSSGEREVVNIAFDFLLRKPQDCIVFFDEPELHLHPELTYKLLSVLRGIGTRNQFILSTHSPDVITASLDESVIFLSPPRSNEEGDPSNQAIQVAVSDETNQALQLLGHSIGIVALGKKIVLIEGDESSLDKQTYGSILANEFPNLVLVPSGGKHAIESFDAIYGSVLSKTIWGVDFFMLCDRDARPPSSSEELAAISSGRLRLLPGYHVENAFLNERVWAAAFSGVEAPGSWLLDPAQIQSAFENIAREVVPYATALFVTHALRQTVGNINVMPKGVQNKTAAELAALFEATSKTELDRVSTALDTATVRGLVESTYLRLENSISSGTGEWKLEIPGKPILKQFASRAKLPYPRAKTMYISAASVSSEDPFGEIREIFRAFSS
jgi:hypothetical protein